MLLARYVRSAAINRGYFKVVKRYLNADMVYFVGLKDLYALLDKTNI